MAARFSVRWIVASYVLIAGGLAIGAVTMALVGIGEPWTGHTGYFIGALAGGFTVSRASGRRTIAEPAVGGLLLAGTLFGVFGASPGSSYLWAGEPASKLLGGALSFGFVTLVGALAGALLGDRTGHADATSPGPPGPLAQLWIAWLAYAGSVLVFRAGALIVTQTARDGWDLDNGLIVMFMATATAGGFVARMAAPGGRVALAAAGPMVAMIYLSVVWLATIGLWSWLGLMLLVVGALHMLPAAAGAAIAQSVFTEGDEAPTNDVPTARARRR